MTNLWPLTSYKGHIKLISPTTININLGTPKGLSQQCQCIGLRHSADGFGYRIPGDLVGQSEAT